MEANSCTYLYNPRNQECLEYSLFSSLSSFLCLQGISDLVLVWRVILESSWKLSLNSVFLKTEGDTIHLDLTAIR